MKNQINLSVIAFMTFIFIFSNLIAQDTKNFNEETQSLIKNITWIQNACVKIDGSQKLYFDPYDIQKNDTADIILITHDHGDHFSMGDINQIKGEKTIIVGPECVTVSLGENARTVKAGDEIEVNGVQIKVEPSYNIDKPYHPKERGYVGFIVTMDRISYFHPGDSDFIPEFKAIKTDVAFLPVCGTYMMSALHAADLAATIKPKVAIPFHWGSMIGSKADAVTFKSNYSGLTVILESNK